MSQTRVTAFTKSLVCFELLARLRRLRGWDRTIARNEWFQRKAVAALSPYQPSTINHQPILFSYSYAALEIFRHAKKHGWHTVLGQIDPGPVEEEIVQHEYNAQQEFGSDWQAAPREYWQNWREECDLADVIIANSEWSRQGLIKAGVNGDKLSVIPLAYERPLNMPQPSRDYPPRFTKQRPLRVLFLGQFNLRKGGARLVQAAELLQDKPIEFWMVGPLQLSIPERLRKLNNIRWYGRIAHREALKFYEAADVFILPTLSDGFALTQLEAQAHRLPLIASRFCGEVVEDGVNGIVFEDLTPAAVVMAVEKCLDAPEMLAALSVRSRVPTRFTLKALAQELCRLNQRLDAVSPST